VTAYQYWPQMLKGGVAVGAVCVSGGGQGNLPFGNTWSIKLTHFFGSDYYEIYNWALLNTNVDPNQLENYLKLLVVKLQGIKSKCSYLRLNNKNNSFKT